MSSRSLFFGLCSAAAAATLVACGGAVGAYQGQDRPDDVGVLGPPPPYDFHCERGERHAIDANGDGRPDGFAHVLSTGETICRGDDSDADGRVDTWTRVEHGKVVERARDTNHDGELDERARDTDGDGTLDQVIPFAPVGAKPARDAGT